MKTRCRIALLPLLFPAIASAETTWIHPGTGNWFDSANWSAGVPVAGEETLIGSMGSGTAEIVGGEAFAGPLKLLSGSLSISAGGRLQSGETVIRYGIDQVVSVSGVGSTWTATDLRLSFDGAGGLAISDGGAVHATGSMGIGQDHRQGMTTVSGADSTLTVGDSLAVGVDGNGNLAISDGATVTVGQDLNFANKPGISTTIRDGLSTITVTGDGSSLEVGGTLAMIANKRQQARLEILDGATMTVGNLAGAGTHSASRDTSRIASIVVGGVGSTLEVTGSAVVADQAIGVVTLKDGGTLSVGGGAGTLDLSAQSGGGYLVIGGDFSPGGGDTPATVAGTLLAASVRDGAIRFNSTNDVTFAPGMEGALGVSLHGPGTVTLERGNTYTGSTSVYNGTLLANNSEGSATGLSTVSVGEAGRGGTLGGSGRIAGPVTVNNGGIIIGSLSLDGGLTVANGGHLSPGGAGGTATITASSLRLSAAANLNFDLGTSSDLVNVTGALTLDGLFNLTPGAGFGTGSYRLFNYGGALTDHGLAMGLVPGGYTYSVSATGGEVNLIVSYDGLAFWNGGSEGTWNASNTSWTNFEQSSSFAWIPGTAVFRNDYSTVTIEGTQTISGVQIGAGATLSGGGLHFTDGAEFRVDDSGYDGTVHSVISGEGGLVKSGGGGLTLTAENTFTGGVSINSGTLEASTDAAFGDASNAITFYDGTLRFAGETARDISIISSATFDFSGDLSLNGAVTGGGTLIKKGTGSLEFGQAPGYTGGTVVDEGWIFTNGFSLTTQYLAGSGQLSLATEDGPSGDLTLTGQSDAEFAGYLFTPGALNKLGGGTQVFSGETRVGSVTINAGTLRAGSATGFADNIPYTVNGGTLDLDGFHRTVSSLSGSGADAVIDLGTATLTVDQDVDTTYSGSIIGESGSLAAASLVKTGTGRLTLDGESSFTGSTSVHGGQLVVAAGGVLAHGGYAAIGFGGSAIVEGEWTIGNSLNVGGIGSGALTIRDGGKVTTAFDAIIGASFDTGVVTVTGAGSSWTVENWILIGGQFNGAQGALDIAAGGSVTSGAIHMASAPFSSATLNVSSGGTLTTGYIQKDEPSGPPITASVTIDGGTLRATGDQSDYLRGFSPGDITIAAGGLTFDTSYDTTDEAGDPTVAGAHVTIAAPLGGAGGLTKTGLGTLTLESANTYTGSTTVAAGTLVLNGSMTSDVTVQAGATFGGDGFIDGGITLEAGSMLAPVDCLDASSLTWNPGATLIFALGSAGDSDRIDLASNLTKDGEGTFALTFTDAGWEIGETYTLIVFGGTNFDEDDFSFTNGGGFDGAFHIDDNTLKFTLTAVPEPSTWSLAIGGFLLMIALSARLTRKRTS